MEDKLLNLPWQIQLALGAGYLAYLIAYSGIRQHHTATDIVFRSFAFGLPATGVLLWAPFKPAFLLCIATLASILTGALWRWQGMGLARKTLGLTNISWADDIPSAWLSITASRTDYRPSQIAVDLSDGRILVCDDTRQFESAPFGPCIFGLDGSVAIYVTAEMRSDGTWIEKADVFDEYDGPRLTYVPVGSIKRVEIRHWSKSIVKAGTATAHEVDGQAAPTEAAAEQSQEYKSDVES